MTRTSGDAIPVMDDAVRIAAGSSAESEVVTVAKAPSTTARNRGQWGVSFDGLTEDGARAPGLTFERRWTTPGVHPYDEVAWELRTATISSETGKTVFEQKDVEVPTFWSQLATNVVVSKYFRGHIGTPRARAQRPAAHRPRRQHDRGLGRHAALLRDRRGPRGLPGRADPPAPAPEDGLQQPGLVQRRRRADARSARPASSTPSRTRCARSWTSPRPRPCSSSTARARASTSRPSAAEGADVGRRHRHRPGQLHEGLRRVRRRRQVGRQDPPRGQDGHPRRRPPGRPRLHRLQGERGEEGLGPHRAGLRPLASRARPTARSSSRTPTTPCA